MYKKIARWGAISIVVLLGILWFVYRPWALTWGATREEISRAMPGDTLVVDPQFNATRGVTIEASADEIWPWIVQIGYRRAGFYSHDRLDNDGIPSATQILPQYQDLEVGDRIPLGRGSYVDVEELEPHRFLVLSHSHAGEIIFSWVFALYQESPERTRLVTRLRAWNMHPVGKLMWDFGEIIMMRKCMLGIKERAEACSG